MDKIKIKVGVDEWSNLVYFRTFQIKDRLPEIGDEQSDGTTVTAIRECYRDCEDRTPYAENYCYYCVESRYLDEDGDPFEEFLAIEHKLFEVKPEFLHLWTSESYYDDDDNPFVVDMDEIEKHASESGKIVAELMSQVEEIEV